jgi:hypothetical protein
VLPPRLDGAMIPWPAPRAREGAAMTNPIDAFAIARQMLAALDE